MQSSLPQAGRAKDKDFEMWLFLAFVIVPIVEIGLFITVGGAIGLWPTLAIVILTAIVGTQLMRHQGISTLNRLQTNLAQGKNPTDPIAQGAMILVAGVLLLTPGFFTDALGFLLLIPLVRKAIIAAVASRISVSGVQFSASSQTGTPYKAGDGDIIDAEYDVLDDEGKTPPENPSGWTKH